MIHIQSNIILHRPSRKPILIDSFINTKLNKQPLIIFCHGYKGYKDWGAWNLMAKSFAEKGFAFVKFNFSHNGGTLDQPINFSDLEAFGLNNYSKELNDLGDVIDWCVTEYKTDTRIDSNHIILMGHSRGGGIAVLKAAEDPRVKSLISLAGVSDYKSRFPSGAAFNKWKKQGVYYIKNGRTLQDMPHYFQFYEDFVANEERLTISKAAASLNQPYLIIHGTADEAVAPSEAECLHKWCSNSQLYWLKGANHVFGMKQPWDKQNLPKDMTILIDACCKFLN